MTDQKNSNQVVKLKWLDAKEPDPSLINVQELRGRNVKEELHTSSISPLPPGPIGVQSTLDKKTLAYHPDLDTNQGETIDGTLRKDANMFNQTLLITTGSIHNSNIGSNSDPHDGILDRQSASTFNINDFQKQTIPPHKVSYNIYSTDYIRLN